MLDSRDLQESEKDWMITKEWLVKEVVVDLSEPQWISLIDDQGITLNGTQPIKVVIKKLTRTPAEVIADMKEKVWIQKLECKNDYRLFSF